MNGFRNVNPCSFMHIKQNDFGKKVEYANTH